jgi:hypothetical protein
MPYGFTPSPASSIMEIVHRLEARYKRPMGIGGEGGLERKHTPSFSTCAKVKVIKVDGSGYNGANFEMDLRIRCKTHGKSRNFGAVFVTKLPYC